MTDIRILKARSQLVQEPAFAFFGALVMRLKVKETHVCQTMVTDGTTLYYNPNFLQQDHDPVDLRRMVAHEGLHCALGHHTRREKRDPRLWNIAADHVVNLILKAAGFVIPPNRFCDPRFASMSAERVYRILWDEQQKQSEPDESEPPSSDDVDGEADGSGGEEAEPDSDQNDADDSEDDESENDADDVGSERDGADPDANTESSDGGSRAGDHDPVCHGDPGLDGEVIDAAPAGDQPAIDEQDQEWKIAVSQAAAIASRIDPGNLPGFIRQIVDQSKAPRIDWRDVLRRFVDPQSSTRDYSRTRPNRRMMGMGYFVPGLVSDGLQHIALLIDASGSIDENLLATFGAEVQSALDAGAIDKVSLVFCDNRVAHTAEYATGEIIDFTVHGRGGTAFAPAFKWVSDNVPDVACAVYFTDMECTDYGPEPHYPVLFAAYGNPIELEFWAPRRPWGELVEITEI